MKTSVVIVGLSALIASLGEAQMIGIYQPIPNCKAVCDSGCPPVRRALEGVETVDNLNRNLQAECEGVDENEKRACSTEDCTFPVFNATTPLMLGPIAFAAGVCVNTTVVSNTPTSFRVNCNGGDYITSLDYFNNTANCTSTGIYKKTLAVDTRNNNKDGVYEGPGGVSGPFTFLDTPPFAALKCVSNAAGFFQRKGYDDNGCVNATQGIFGNADTGYYPLGVCTQALDNPFSWAIRTTNGTHMIYKEYFDVTGSKEGTCTGNYTTAYVPLNVCFGNGIWSFSGATSNIMMDGIIAIGVIAVSTFMI